MTVAEVLEGVQILTRAGAEALFGAKLTGVQYDSRKIEPGNLFVAMKGGTSDGNQFIDAAIQKGAVAVVADSEAAPLRSNVAGARVAHGRRALARVSANWFGHPSKRLKICGVTGTNGKTTTAFLLSQILQFAGRGEVVLIGTVEYHYAGKVVPAPHTTPESLEINRMFAEVTDARLGKSAASEAVMEVSSHALAQERVYGLPFDVAIFTNLTRDHLDFHGTMDEYFAAKEKLFAGCGAPPPRVAVINADDQYGTRLAALAKSLGSEVVSYGIQGGEVRAEQIKISSRGTEFKLHTASGYSPIESKLLGKVNIYNLLAASAAALARGVDLNALVAAIAHSHGAPGRFERVDCGQPFAVVVDYAHTDDALRNLTALARDFVSGETQRGRVITLFGCGGDRDRTKRPLMGKAAGEGSDFVVLTSDNPRSEAPMAIIKEALLGLVKTATPYAIEPDRRKAIALAISEARAGDIVLIAGKGHEKVQVTREGTFPFADVEVARAALEAAGHGSKAMKSERA